MVAEVHNLGIVGLMVAEIRFSMARIYGSGGLGAKVTRLWALRAPHARLLREPTRTDVADYRALHMKPKMPSKKNLSAVGAGGSMSEVEEICAENTTKRPVESSAPDQAAASRLRKRVKIVVKKHKSRHGEGSSLRAAREKESAAQAEEGSAGYRCPASQSRE
ncbi:hypothetical protein B296_00045965 [Ensete ventricosum]|uniref:Uncharacterized protein n=1 Tax=Ensete ventricosum TaxID=4639 RepID=A0A426XWB8_ENSVE|nr:hypothetical protein B296_00045965 [Ensete ventricosum]